MNLNNENTKQILFIIVFAIVVYTGFQNISTIFSYIGIILGIFIPFFIGGSIAFVLNIPMKAIENKIININFLKKHKISIKISRPVSLVLSVVLVTGIVAGVINIVVPQLVTTFHSIGNNIYVFIPKAVDFFETVVKSDEAAYYIEQLKNWDWKTVFSYIENFLKSGGNVLNSTIGVVRTIFSTTVNIIIGLIFAIYILLQKEKLSVQCVKILFAIVPKKYAVKTIDIAKMTYGIFSSFVTGQCLEACILGTMFFIVLSICRMPYSLLIGVLIAFTALIPIVGAFIGCFISALLILMISPIKAVIFVAIFLILQQIEGNLIYPHVVGNSVGLPSMWVLVAVTVGANLFGVLGILFFIPLSSVIYALFKTWVNNRIKKADIDLNNYINN